MTKLEILNDAVHIDASIVAQHLGFEPSFVQTCAYRKSNPRVLMVQATENRSPLYASCCLNGTLDRRVLSQG
jgi:hypothetical protein